MGRGPAHSRTGPCWLGTYGAPARRDARETAINGSEGTTSAPPGKGTVAPATAELDLGGVAALRAVLRIRPFRRLWIVTGFASLGDWVGLLATAVFASNLVVGAPAQGAAFGGTIAIRLLPALILAPFVGVLADRWDRRITMVVCDVIRFLFYLGTAVALLFVETNTTKFLLIAVVTVVAESVSLVWNPTKDAAVPNLIPRSKLEVSNQLTLITTYGISPVVAALGLAIIGAVVGQLEGPHHINVSYLAFYYNAASRLVMAIVVFYGIREISGRSSAVRQAKASMLRQLTEGWKYIGRSAMLRGLVLGTLGAFAGGGVVIGTAKFFAISLGAGDVAFNLLFGALFVGLSLGIGAGPALVKALSRRRWFGMSIVLAGLSLFVLAVSIHLSMALLGAVLVGSGAGMAFLSAITLLGVEVGDDIRGRVNAFIQTSVQIVLMLASSLSGILVGLGGSRRVTLPGGLHFSFSTTRGLLFVAGGLGILAGISAFRQMDDKPGVPVLRDLWWSMRGRPLSLAHPVMMPGLFVVFEGGEGAGKSTQVNTLADRLRAADLPVTVTREPGATAVGARIRALLLEQAADGTAPGPRAEALLYAADRAHHVASLVRPALERGDVVISDRYVDSSLAYQGAGRTLAVDDIAWLSAWATGGLKPDLVVLLDIDPRVGLARAAARGTADRLESESLAFHDRVRDAFLDQAAADPTKYLVLDATLPTDTLAALIRERIDELLAVEGLRRLAESPISADRVVAS